MRAASKSPSFRLPSQNVPLKWLPLATVRTCARPEDCTPLQFTSLYGIVAAALPVGRTKRRLVSRSHGAAGCPATLSLCKMKTVPFAVETALPTHTIVPTMALSSLNLHTPAAEVRVADGP